MRSEPQLRPVDLRGFDRYPLRSGKAAWKLMMGRGKPTTNFGSVVMRRQSPIQQCRAKSSDWCRRKELGRLGYWGRERAFGPIR